jgi:hypothetical protein
MFAMVIIVKDIEMVFRAINVFNFASVVIVIQCFVKTGVP